MLPQLFRSKGDNGRGPLATKQKKAVHHKVFTETSNRAWNVAVTRVHVVLISDFKIRAWNFVVIFHCVQAERLGKFLDYPKFCLLGLGQTPNFSWDTKLDELSSWSSLSSSEFVCLVRSTRSIRLKQTDRTSDDRFGDKRRSSHVTNQTNKLKICSIMYI